MALGLQYELSRYKVDICTWRMGEIAREPKEQASLIKPTPEEYVQAAMSKC